MDWANDAELASRCLRAFDALYRASNKNPRLRVFTSVRGWSQALVRNEWGFSQALVRMNRLWFSDLASTPPRKWAEGSFPEWRIATTDYAAPSRTLLVVNSRQYARSEHATYEDVVPAELPRAVAASSAVPGIFEPVRFRQYLLGDGGVLDNLGVHELRHSEGHSVCIDATAAAVPVRHVDGWTTPVRAMDLLMDQDRDEVIRSSKAEVISLRDLNFGNGDWPELLPALRTDLDAFTCTEAGLLFLAGYQSTLSDRSLPRTAPNSDVENVWRRMMGRDREGASGGHRRRLESVRESLIAELRRGRYGIGAGYRSPSTLSFMMTSGAIYMSVVFTLMAGVCLSALAAGAVLRSPTWVQAIPARLMIVAAWIASSVWLAQYLELRKMGVLTRLRQLLGVLAGGLLFLPLVFSVLSTRCCTAMFFGRDLTFWTRWRSEHLPD